MLEVCITISIAISTQLGVYWSTFHYEKSGDSPAYKSLESILTGKLEISGF